MIMVARPPAVSPARARTARARAQGRTFDVYCTVSVSHTFENLSADVAIEPGDRVHVHGGAIHPPYGEVQVERRLATVTRAGWVERTWTRMTGDLDCLSLLEVSFSDRRSP